MICTLLFARVHSVDADDEDVDNDDQKVDALYESFYVDPLSGHNDESDIDLAKIVIEPKILKQDPQYFIEQAKVEEQDIEDIQEQNLPKFLMVREGIEAAQSYEQAGQAFLEKDDTQQAVQAYQKALQMYENTQRIAMERHERREIKHAIRSAKYIMQELQKNKKVKKQKNKKGEK